MCDFGHSYGSCSHLNCVYWKLCINHPYSKNIHSDTLADYNALVNIIDQLPNLYMKAGVGNGYEDGFKEKVKAKHYLGNILENVQPK